MKTTLFSESVGGIGGARVDREAGVIRGAKLVGTVSANKRKYPLQVLSKAKPLYEGARVYIGHLRSVKGEFVERSMDDFWGTVKNVTERPDGLYGDIEFNRSHPKTAMLIEAAERFPNAFGMSHNARGKEDSAGNVLDIERVISVDVVADPATTKGLFESKDPASMSRVLLKTLIESISKFEGAKPLVEAFGRDDLAGIDVPMPSVADPMSGVETPGQPAVPPAGQPANSASAAVSQVKEGLRAAALEAIDDESLTPDVKMGRLKSIVMAMADVENVVAPDLTKPADPVSGEDKTDKTKKPEELKESMSQELIESLQKEVADLKAEKAANEDRAAIVAMLTESKLDADDLTIKVMTPLNAEDRKAYVERQKTLMESKGSDSSRPAASRAAWLESKETSKYPDSVEEMKKRLR